jgi:uncharacterized membrane protein
MRHLHKRVLTTGLVCLALLALAFALLGIGFAAMVAVGLFVVLGLVLIGLMVFEEEAHEPFWEQAQVSEQQHGYHPPTRP